MVGGYVQIILMLLASSWAEICLHLLPWGVSTVHFAWCNSSWSRLVHLPSEIQGQGKPSALDTQLLQPWFFLWVMAKVGVNPTSHYFRLGAVEGCHHFHHWNRCHSFLPFSLSLTSSFCCDPSLTLGFAVMGYSATLHNLPQRTTWPAHRLPPPCKHACPLKGFSQATFSCSFLFSIFFARGWRQRGLILLVIFWLWWLFTTIPFHGSRVLPPAIIWHAIARKQGRLTTPLKVRRQWALPWDAFFPFAGHGAQELGPKRPAFTANNQVKWPWERHFKASKTIKNQRIPCLSHAWSICLSQGNIWFFFGWKSGQSDSKNTLNRPIPKVIARVLFWIWSIKMSKKTKNTMCFLVFQHFRFVFFCFFLFFLCF